MVNKVRSQIDIPQLIGKTVRVYLATKDVKEGVFMDDRGHAILIRTINNKYVSILWDKIVYVEEI